MKHVVTVSWLFSLFSMPVDGWLTVPTSTKRTMPLIARRANPEMILQLDDHPNDITLTRKKAKTKTKVTPSDTPASVKFWHNTSDPIIFQYHNDTLTGLQFRIRGNPLPLQRHRQTRRGIVYNPSSSAQAVFRNTLETLMSANNHQHQRPLLGDAPLHMSCAFHLKRSLSDFVANTRGRPLKQQQQPKAVRTPDVDNLAKFVLDSFNGVLYTDDQQIVSLSVVKTRDSEGDCLGYTDILLSTIVPGTGRIE